MTRFAGTIFIGFLALLLAACGTNDGVFEDGPRLISEITLPPVTTAPTRVLSPTPSPATPESTEAPEVVATFTQSSFVMSTPTLPPTKTPTITPSVTNTVVATPTTPPPTRRVVEQDPILVPTMVFAEEPQQAIAANPTVASPQGEVSIPLPGVPDVPQAACTSAQWFFQRPVLPDCPLQPAVVSDGAFQGFQYGYMIWVSAQDAIYVIYQDDSMPRWQVFQDTWEEGMPDSDPSLDAQAPPYAEWQPRRGFGLIWRNTPGMISRIGWAESAYEAAYTVNVQTRQDGTVFIGEPFGRVFALLPSGDWELHSR